MTTASATAARSRVGKKSVIFPSRPGILSSFTLGGPMEGKGPLGQDLDAVMPDTFYGEKCWEQTESKMLLDAIRNCIANAGAEEKDVDFLLTGDLLAQTIASSFAVRDLPIPHIGLFAACATFAEGLILAAMALEGGFATSVVVGVSSHHDSAERQFRFPTELGVQRPPTAQWTATLSAAVLLGLVGETPFSDGKAPIRLARATLGEVIDIGIKDPYDMGTAMAPAAVDTLSTHFADFQLSPDEYDLIITGDLGAIGHAIATDLLESKGYALRERFADCGLLLYDRERQDVHAGGSGTGCSAGVFCAHIAKEMRQGRYRRVLFAPTGSLHSPTSYKQGEAIPAICHAVALEIDER